MSFQIESAKKGNTKTQVQLAELYLNERFKYFDVEEGTFWLEQAKETSFHANIILAEIYFSSNYDFNKHGESLINAIDLYESGTDINYISDTLLIDAYQNAASYFNQIGAPEKAEMLLRKSSLYFLESDQNLLDIWRKTLLAGVSSDYASSILYLENIIEENKTSEGVASSRFLNAVRLLHEKYLQGRETRKALDLAIDSMNTFSKFGTVSNQLEMMLLVSKDFIELGDYKNAKKYIELYDSFGTAGNVWTLIVKGILEIQSGGVDNGFEKINKALILVEEGSIPLRNYDLEIAIIAMQLLNQGGNYDLSASLMKKVVAFYRQGVELRIKHKSIISPYEKNQIRDAISEYIFASTKSTENLKDLGFEDMQLASGLTLSDTVIKSISKKELKGTLYIKSKLLEALNSQRRKMVEEKFEILGSSNTNLVKINIKLDDLDKKINSLERDLKGLNIDTLSAFITPLKLVKENLSEADGLITMLISNQRSYVWLTTKEGVFRHDSELTLSDVKKHSTQLLNALNPSSVNNNSFPIESSSKLYDLLIKPFEVELKGIDRLIFSPDPVLSQIPFSVLTKSGSIGAEVVTNSGDLRGVATVKINSLDMTNTNLENVEWLIEDFAVAIVPSIYSYVGLEASNEEEFGALNSFLGIGNPTLSGSEVVFKSDISVAMSDQRGSISRTLSDLSALPETETELNIIANYFSSSEIITQGNATEAKIRDMDLSGIEVIAFATHALVSNEIDDLLEPAIVLTPVDSDNPDNDGLLMASEVAKLNMDADIVLLSACNTASSFDESNSQGLSGLADSFFEAGAKSILASYWSVISDSAVEITTKMFDKSNTGRSYSHKHRESILKILEESNSYKSNPVYWAPFMVVGVN
jgi:CHAT domain-containing protein